MNATLRTVDGLAVLRMERRLAHPPEKVWRALTDPDHLNRWYPFQATELELRVGGRIAFDDGTGTTVEGVVTELDSPRVLAFTQDASAVLQREGDNHLRFELRPDGDGCLLVFTHTFHDRPHAAANAAGWHACFDALDAVVDSRPAEMPPSFVELHEAYVEAFGLDQGLPTVEEILSDTERTHARVISWVCESDRMGEATGCASPDGIPVVPQRDVAGSSRSGE